MGLVAASGSNPPTAEIEEASGGLRDQRLRSFDPSDLLAGPAAARPIALAQAYLAVGAAVTGALGAAAASPALLQHHRHPDRRRRRPALGPLDVPLRGAHPVLAAAPRPGAGHGDDLVRGLLQRRQHQRLRPLLRLGRPLRLLLPGLARRRGAQRALGVRQLRDRDRADAGGARRRLPHRRPSLRDHGGDADHRGHAADLPADQGGAADAPAHRRRPHGRPHRPPEPRRPARGAGARARARQARGAPDQPADLRHRPLQARQRPLRRLRGRPRRAQGRVAAGGVDADHGRRRALGRRGVRDRAARDRPAPRLPLRRGAAGPRPQGRSRRPRSSSPPRSASRLRPGTPRTSRA